MSCKKADYRENLLANTGRGLADMAHKTYGGTPYFFAKAGNITSIYNIANHAVNGDIKAMNEASISFAGGWAAGVGAAKVTGAVLAWTGAATVASGGLLAITFPALAAIAIGTAASYFIDKYFEDKDCDHTDPTSPYLPQPNETPVVGYKVQYYDPIILDLNGDGVGTIAKFGYYGAMFDHDGMAVNDELYQIVI